MATLLLSAVGTALGGPLGGALGALIGRQVDSAVIGGGAREGPRLKDLSVQTSTYGAALPWHFGAMRAAGQVIWATGLVEHRDRQSGGKGRPAVVSYTYTASFAVALASRPIAGIGRIWADGNLLRGAAGDLKVAGALRIYTGHGDQPIDPLIAQAEGALRAPAHRGTAYVVFEDLALADYGNRLPSLSFEIFADGAGCTLASVVEAMLPQAMLADLAMPLAGYSLDGGSPGATLAALAQAIPLGCALRGESLAVFAAEPRPAVPPLLPLPVAGGHASDAVQATGWSRRRDPLPPAQQAAVRYYDTGRDYQIGLQRGIGRAGTGDTATIDLPAALDAATARGLAEAAGRRLGRPADTMRYRIAEIDPALAPGGIVRVPLAPGLWRIDQWEWQADGVLLDLSALPPVAPGQSASDPGRSNPAADLAPAPTVLAAIELPWDGVSGSGDVPMLYAAAGAASAGWTGAALYVAARDGALTPLGATGRRRAVTGVAVTALAAASPLLVDRASRVEIALTDPGLTPPAADLAALIGGANRALIGGEIIQFGSVAVRPDGHIVLSGLLRGRGGSEAAVSGHAAGERFVLLDDALIALDPATVGDAASAVIAALGLADPAPVTAPVSGAGATRQPLSPVHGRATRLGDGSITLGWVRRARGAWQWADMVEVPLNEQAEAWQVTFGDPLAPRALWQTATTGLTIAPTVAAQLAADAAPHEFHIRQLGSVSASPPLVIALPA